MVNGTLFGRGEIVVIGDHCSLRVTDMVKPETD
jgi:flagellar motor switch/type III secretory pathway protein FliN